MADESDGLLATDVGNVTCFTGRGSHTAACLRCVQYATRGIHPELCSDGVVSKAKICEMQPSMEEPFRDGVPVDVLDADLAAVACPRLMPTLSRVDNSHAVGRLQTVLQMCNRIASLLAANPQASVDRICELAAIGLATTQAADIKLLVSFVKSWSGGQGHLILKDLEEYEKTMTQRRKIHAGDLHNLASVDSHELETFVPAMVKSMLNSPQEFTDGQQYSSLFKIADCNTLRPGGRNRANAVTANLMMVSAKKFLQAYSRLAKSERTKLMSDLEVKCVMHVLQKKASSRTEYASLAAIAGAMYDEAKKLDPNLPKWSKLEAQRKANPTPPKVEVAAAASSSTMREIRSDGTITNEELCHRGFVVGAKVVRVNHDNQKNYDIEANRFRVESYDSILKCVTLERVKKPEAAADTEPAKKKQKGATKTSKDDTEEPATVSVLRSDMIKYYQVEEDVVTEARACIWLMMRALNSRAVNQHTYKTE